MSIIALGYMGIRSPSLGDWSDYARRQLGMQQVDRGGGTLSFRMDDWQQRLVLLDEPGQEFAFMGWQVESADELDGLAAGIEEFGISVTEADRALCDQRFVTRMIVCDDP
ncbi:MAG: biphenyl 2,3-dioxygenase, partial [Candidatus Puniceispirillaceae bacterium]